LFWAQLWGQNLFYSNTFGGPWVVHLLVPCLGQNITF
jgi:hypothetical protein